MNQSAFIVGALLAGFVLYVTAKGRLPVYTSVIWGPVQTSSSSGSKSGGFSLPGLGSLGSLFGLSGDASTASDAADAASVLI